MLPRRGRRLGYDVRPRAGLHARARRHPDAQVNADWRAVGADELTVELQVDSQLTYRAWTTLLRDQPADHFATASLQVTQGERRFDFRIVARDNAGNEWPSEAFVVQ